MIVCKVIGHVWATKKEEGLTGFKLMVVQETETAKGISPVSTSKEKKMNDIVDSVLESIPKAGLVVAEVSARPSISHRLTWSPFSVPAQSSRRSADSPSPDSSSRGSA